MIYYPASLCPADHIRYIENRGIRVGSQKRPFVQKNIVLVFLNFFYLYVFFFFLLPFIVFDFLFSSVAIASDVPETVIVKLITNTFM